MQKGRSKYLIFSQRHLGVILLFTMCVIALFSFDEYGIGWDELRQRETGMINWRYIFSDDPGLLTYQDRDYGVAFELPLVMIEKTFNLTDTRDVYLMRHLVTHLFFLLGAFFCFKLVDFLYQNKLLATVAFLLIVLHPRLYAHSFFNSKDIPFMSMFVICLYFNAIAFRKKTVNHFIVLGISIGLLINLRIMGALLPCCIFLFLIVDAAKEKEYMHHLKLGLILLGTSAVVLYTTWPFLWPAPVEHFGQAFKNMSDFRWDYAVLLNGESIIATNLPWYYAPLWFSITTPIVYLITGLSAAALLIFHFLKKPLDFTVNLKERNNLIFLICCFSPVLAVIVLKSVLYDGWRQLYFIYPSFVLLAIYGLHLLHQKNKRRWIVAGSLLTFISISIVMIKDFPFQHVYFNQSLALKPPEYIRKSFELDYWGTSYRQSLEYILKNDNSESINICVANVPGQYNVNILPSEQRRRIHFVPIEKATYFITNYRWHPQDYTELEEFRFHAFTMGNNTVSEIFKLN